MWSVRRPWSCRCLVPRFVTLGIHWLFHAKGRNQKFSHRDKTHQVRGEVDFQAARFKASGVMLTSSLSLLFATDNPPSLRCAAWLAENHLSVRQHCLLVWHCGTLCLIWGHELENCVVVSGSERVIPGGKYNQTAQGLMISPVTLHDEDEYTCKASNSAGEKSSSGRLSLNSTIPILFSVYFFDQKKTRLKLKSTEHTTVQPALVVFVVCFLSFHCSSSRNIFIDKNRSCHSRTTIGHSLWHSRNSRTQCFVEVQRELSFVSFLNWAILLTFGQGGFSDKFPLT